MSPLPPLPLNLEPPAERARDPAALAAHVAAAANVLFGRRCGCGWCLVVCRGPRGMAALEQALTGCGGAARSLLDTMQMLLTCHLQYPILTCVGPSLAV
jgi:hypothetical protein